MLYLPIENLWPEPLDRRPQPHHHEHEASYRLGWVNETIRQLVGYMLPQDVVTDPIVLRLLARAWDVGGIRSE